ncbi:MULTISPECIES: allantoinase [Neobacillus]|uniref:Allantoinase n=1 Tax=Neobacillus rhizophilus TaxID=2833579 RepID=A0A942U2V4_9BACI|nr:MULTISPECIES: allantoinase [Neobacillus]MBS4211277.1 allantoinase [Neobacillus rhizophilus]
MLLYDLIIRNGMVVGPEESFTGEIGIKNGKIIKITRDIPIEGKAKEEIDASGLHIFPGLIDTHVHFNEPGRTDWEGILTGSKSLAAGGVTTYFDMPLNSNPPTIDAYGFRLKQEQAIKKSVTDFRLWGGLVPENVQLLEELIQTGVIGFKAFMSPSGIDEFHHSDDATLMAGMGEIARLGSILAVHAESTVMTEVLAAGKIKEGKFSALDYCESRPIISEMEAVRRLLSYAELTGCKVHIVHASSSKVVELITEAKKKGIDVTVETCPHYLSLTSDDFARLGPIAKCAPPLRSSEEVEELWKVFANGEIDVIGSDHSPAPPEMKSSKDGNMFAAWGGISGAQTSLSVLLEEGYCKRNISLQKIAAAMSTNPAKRFGLYPQKGAVAEGSDADLALISLNESFTLKADDLFYRHTHSPYIGKTFRGKNRITIVKGSIVYRNGEILPQENTETIPQ